MAPKFNLQSVLDVRHNRVEALEIELSRLILYRDEVEASLIALDTLQTQLMLKLEELMQDDEMDLFTLDRLRCDLREVGEAITHTHEELQRASQKVESHRRSLVTARQGEEALDLLKTRMIDGYNREQALAETRQQDDQYIARAFRAQAMRV